MRFILNDAMPGAVPVKRRVGKGGVIVDDNHRYLMVLVGTACAGKDSAARVTMILWLRSDLQAMSRLSEVTGANGQTSGGSIESKVDQRARRGGCFREKIVCHPKTSN